MSFHFLLSGCKTKYSNTKGYDARAPLRVWQVVELSPV